MPSCLDENHVLGFIEGRLRPDERPAVEAHLAACGLCSDLVASGARALRSSATRPERGPPIEATVGRYRLLEPIGYGGGGIVYRARCLDDGQSVALKTAQVRSDAVVAGIRREILALSRLRHPGIVRVVDHGVDRGRPWYAMTLLEGDTLATIARQLFEGAHPDEAAAGRLPWMLTLVSRLCEPLAYLHGEGLVHRDLKPQNVFVSPAGELVLVDFGLTRGAPGALGRETAEVPLPGGTPAYVAPEQITGDAVDARADLYSLGCLVHELVTGRPPFVGTTTTEILQQHLHATPPPMSARVSGVPPELDALVLSLLAKSPRARPGHAGDVAAAIAHLGITRSGAPPERRTTVYRSPLVGRHAELQHLRALAVAARDGRGGGVALVFGESGIGKTFLATEVARGCGGMRIASGTCLPTEAVLTPFRELLELVADRCLARGEEATATLLGPRGAVLSEVVPRLRELPGLDAQAPPPELGGAAARERLLDALRDTLAALARERPLLLLLDDLQWADDLTLGFLESLTAEYFAQHRVFVLATCRSEDRAAISTRLTERPFVTSVALGRLDASSVRSMVAEMLAWDAPPEDLSSALARNAEGNPFFVAEYVRAAVTAGTLRRREGAWTAPPSPETWSLPHTLRELLGSRLDALSPSGRRQCEAAAVLGREFAPELLDEGEATEGVAELFAREILQQSDTGLLRFAHHKLQEAAYERLDEGRRRTLHRAAAAQLETRYGKDAPDRFASLAQHWAAAGDAARAQGYFERAGDHALRVGAYQQAAQMFERSLELEGATGGATGAPGAHRRLGLGHAQFGLGNSDQLEEHALEALALLGWKRARSPRDWESLFGRELATQLAHLTVGARARPSREHPPLRDAALAAGLLGQRYFYLDDAVPMAAMALLAINASEKTGAEGAIPRAYTVMGGLAGLVRARGLSMRYFERAHRAAQDDPSERAMALAVEIVVDGSLGEWHRVQRTGARLTAMLPLLRDPLVRGVVLSTLRHVEFFGGRYEDADARASELLALGQAARNVQHVVWAQYYLARGAIRAGRFDEARPLLLEARKGLEHRKELQSEINCAGFLALTELHLGRPDAALVLADATMDHMTHSRPTGFPSLDGYSAVAEVYRELAARSFPRAGAEPGRRWRGARRALWRLAALYPVALPTALLEAGHARAARGHAPAARVLFGLSARVADRFGMAPDRDAARAALKSA